jgi:hypothetical protein
MPHHDDSRLLHDLRLLQSRKERVAAMAVEAAARGDLRRAAALSQVAGKLAMAAQLRASAVARPEP